MTRPLDTLVTRRGLIRAAGLTVLAGGLVACGKQAGVEESSNIAVAGTTPPTTALPEAEVDDVVLLRTAASLEYTAIDTYKRALGAGLLTGDYAALAPAVNRFIADHEAHANAINTLVREAKGTPWTCGNERIEGLYVEPALELITATDNPDSARDTVALAHGLETLAAHTYQAVVASLSTPALRAAAMRVGQDEARHSAILALVLNPGWTGAIPSVDVETGRPNIAAVPAAFGPLTGIPVSLGAPNAEGVKTSVTLETPSLNALVYSYLAC